MAYVWNGEPRPEPDLPPVPALERHTRGPKRVSSFGDDDEARRQAKRETNAAYRERNKARVLAKQREGYARKKSARNP